jgi:hypothetical protein
MARQGGQGEALATWAVWGATTGAVVVTYARLDPAELYHVSGTGIAGGLGRAVVHLNWPIALAAIATTLVAMRDLPRRAWWIAGPALALCATMPFTVDQADLDARWRNALPAAGAALALGLTVAAGRRAGASFQPRLPGDPVRLLVAVVMLLGSLPWIAAELGFHLPGDVLLGEEPFATADGTPEAAVHLGEHHGFHGVLLLGSALLLSRVQASGRLRWWIPAVTGGLAAYGAVNAVQDAWYEQLVKRGWSEWRIPSALYPGADAVTLVTLAVACAAVWLIARERAILRA